MKSEPMTIEQRERAVDRKLRVCLVGLVVAVIGILAMARENDISVKDVDVRAAKAEFELSAAKRDADSCWKDVHERLKEIIRFRCPPVSLGK